MCLRSVKKAPAREGPDLAMTSRAGLDSCLLMAFGGVQDLCVSSQEQRLGSNLIPVI